MTEQVDNGRMAIGKAARRVVSLVHGTGAIISVSMDPEITKPFTPDGRLRVLVSVQELVAALKADAQLNGDRPTLVEIASGIGTDDELLRTLTGTDTGRAEGVSPTIKGVITPPMPSFRPDPLSGSGLAGEFGVGGR